MNGICLQVGTYDVIELAKMDFTEMPAEEKSNNTGSSLSNFFSMTNSDKTNSSADKNSEKTAPNGSEEKTSEGSEIRLEADLDETSQSSDVMERKFGLKTKTDEHNTCRKVHLRKAPSTVKQTKQPSRLPQLSTCTIGNDRCVILIFIQYLCFKLLLRKLETLLSFLNR